VSDFMVFSGARSMERHAHDNVDILSIVPPKMDRMIMSSWSGLQYFPKKVSSHPVVVSDHALHRSNTPKTRHFITGVTRHWTPLFGFWYGLLSHIALLQRIGQGLTTGWRLSSVPHDSGFTILTSRV
jgi:hypothetical protein